MFGMLIPPSGMTVDKSVGILSNADEISFSICAEPAATSDDICA